MSEYDLTATNALYLDRHLILPLLDFLAREAVHPSADVLRERLSVLAGTDRFDDITAAATEGSGSVPGDLAARKSAAEAALSAHRAQCGPLLAVVENADLVRQLQGDKLFHMNYLAQNHAVTAEMGEAMYALGRAEYAAGRYQQAADLLGYYAMIGTDADKAFSAAWGKLAALSLAKKWDAALREVDRVRDAIESRASGWGRHYQQQQQQKASAEASKAAHPALVIEQRAWLLHWALFVYFNHANGRVALVDFFLNDNYTAALLQTSPHLLRYLAAAVITEPRRKQSIRDVVRLVSTDGIGYSDPVTEFLSTIYVKFDFDDAQGILARCDEVLKNDFFLSNLRTEFRDNARHIIFETFCRVHKRISIPMIGEKLSMSPEEAERWVVNLIRNARLDAKIDSQANCVVMGSHDYNVYQQVIDRTKGLSFRSNAIGNYISKRMAEVAALQASAAAAAATAGGEE